MDMIAWHQLQSFVVVAEEGHVTRAAERLNTQQPPLSMRIRALEKRLDVQLFRRKARGVELTEAGRVLLAHARTLLDQHARTLDAVQRAGRGELGRLCIGTVPTGPLHPLMPSSVRQFREKYPDALVTLEECMRDDLLQRLRDEQIDAGFMRSKPNDDQGLVVEILLPCEDDKRVVPQVTHRNVGLCSALRECVATRQSDHHRLGQQNLDHQALIIIRL